MIRRAKISEISDIVKLTNFCALDMIKNGIYQWNEHYPSTKTFEKDLERDELFVLEIEGVIIGTIVITTIRDEEYIPVDWLTISKNNIYVHRLAIHPNEQGNGHAQKLMDFAEKYAKDKGFQSVRLDTFSKNKRNQKFYETRGYHKLGDIYFPKQSEHPFHCYELIL